MSSSGGAPTDGDVLKAPNVIEYPFKRTTGPVIGAFMTGLREGIIVGIKSADGQVIVPPQEYDPVTAEELTEIVEVGDAGVVTTWCWVIDPLTDQPFDRPFAWAMIRLDGADIAMVHAVDTAGDQGAMRTGMRVKARWRPARPTETDGADGDAGNDDDGTYRVGHILDIVCFEPEGVPS
ncbi:MAG TPA: OB-fold domain-containing protein [Acidimicrobiales bacterium]